MELALPGCFGPPQTHIPDLDVGFRNTVLVGASPVWAVPLISVLGSAPPDHPAPRGSVVNLG